MATKLTKGQRKFFEAVAYGDGGIFHKRVIEPIEGLPFGKPGGLVRWIGGMRLAGCNSFSAQNFRLTDAGEAARRVGAPNGNIEQLLGLT